MNLRLTIVSRLISRGPFRLSRANVPHVYAGGIANAAGLNHWVIDCCAGLGLTPITGLARLLAPVLDGDPGTVTVNGRPDCATSTSPICQSRNSCDATPLPRPSGIW